jgi:tripartite ATP-independent transporter DctP family solute receptor
MKKIGLFLLAMSLLLACVPASAQKPTTLILGWAGSTTDPMYEAACLLAELVDYRSGGRLKIQPTTGLGHDVDLVEGVRTGMVDITICLKGEEYYPPLNLLLVPGIFKSPESMYDILTGPLGQEISEGLRKAAGISIMSWWWQGTRHVTTNKKVGPVREPKDLDGVKMRVPGIKPWLEAFKQTGARITSLPFGEVYLALRQGVVDAQENPVTAIMAMKFYEVQDYLCLTGHIYSHQAFYMNDKRFESLSPDLQKILVDSIEDARLWLLAKTKAIEREGLSFLREQGMEIVEADREAFREVFQKAYPEVPGAVEFAQKVRAAEELGK